MVVRQDVIHHAVELDVKMDVKVRALTNVLDNVILAVGILVKRSVTDVTPLVQEVVVDVMDVPDVVGVTVMLVVQDATVALEIRKLVDILVVDVEDVLELALQDVVLNVLEGAKMTVKVLVEVIVNLDV